MKCSIKLLNIGIVVLSIFFGISCGSGDDDPVTPIAEVDIKEAMLSNFQLAGIEAKNIKIVSPEIVDNKEIKFGEIILTVAAGTSLDAVNVSITSAELDLNTFSISPNNVKLSFKDNKVHVFTISSAIGNKEELLHYKVSVIREDEEVDIKEAKLLGFRLFEIEHKNIELIHPEIVDNKEVKHGVVKLTVAAGTSLDAVNVSITSAELDLSKFDISPGDDVKLSFEDNKVHVFTISSAIGNKEELVHYNVSVVKEAPIVKETLKITDFTFEKSKNPSLPNDITISRTVEESGRDILYVFVPLGTDFTNLVPTITYDGTKLYYTQDSSVAPVDIDTEFPTMDTSIDFKYPKHFILVVRDKNNDKLRMTTVIVDVINPVRIETVSVTTPDVAEGSIPPETFRGVTKWINQGNHPIVFQKATTYENDEPMTDPRVGRVILARRVLPPVALNPGEDENIDVTIDSRIYTEGTYKTTAVFYSRIRNHQSVDDLLEPAKLTITAKIIK